MNACWPALFRSSLLLHTAFCLGMAGCASSSSSPSPASTQKPVDAIPSPLADSTRPPATHTPAPTATFEPPAVWIAPYLPDAFQQELNLPTGWVTTQDREAALSIDSGGAGTVLSTWIYALVAPFPFIPGEVATETLTGLWAGLSPGEYPEITHLWLTQSTLEMLIPLLGEPDASTVVVMDEENLLTDAWEHGSGWAIIPFEQLEPRWKVLAIDGQSPIRKDFAPESYLLAVPITATSEQGTLPEGLSSLPGNRSPEYLTTVMLTGVTALVRATGALMELNGIAYPAEQIGDLLRDADILHINNEVPFAQQCPSARLQQNTDLVFCSRVEYIELLEVIGTDVVELCGDHFQDWGPEAMLYTVKLYKERQWGTYGGGINLEAARQPFLMEHNGNKLAFLGCNAKPPGYARASDEEPGAFHCNFEYMEAEIQRLKEEGYLPIVTFQHLEYYDYGIHPLLQIDFRRMAEAGAVIVSGSQAHQPHGMEFYDGAFLHYGLGNLFFDQYYEGIPTRQATIDRHVFYAGRHISTELLPIKFIDLAQSRPMTPEEQYTLLEIIFQNSNWETLSDTQ